MKQLPASSKKDNWQGFALQNGSGKKGSLSRVPGDVEALQNAHVWQVLDEHVTMVVDEKDPRQLTGNTIL